MKRIPIKELSGDAIESQTRRVDDWAAGYGEKWDYYEAGACDKCGKLIVAQGETMHKDWADGDCDCDGYVFCEGPMMNYWYPLPDEVRAPEKAAELIADLPLCIVHMQDTDEWGLALTGGGQDLSWEICEAFMRLGYCPPHHFRLPGMAGKDYGSPRNRWIIAGCRKSAQVMIKRARWNIRSLMQLKKGVAA